MLWWKLEPAAPNRLADQNRFHCPNTPSQHPKKGMGSDVSSSSDYLVHTGHTGVMIFEGYSGNDG